MILSPYVSLYMCTTPHLCFSMVKCNPPSVLQSEEWRLILPRTTLKELLPSPSS